MKHKDECYHLNTRIVDIDKCEHLNTSNVDIGKLSGFVKGSPRLKVGFESWKKRGITPFTLRIKECKDCGIKIKTIELFNDELFQITENIKRKVTEIDLLKKQNYDLFTANENINFLLHDDNRKLKAENKTLQENLTRLIDECEKKGIKTTDVPIKTSLNLDKNKPPSHLDW